MYADKNGYRLPLVGWQEGISLAFSGTSAATAILRGGRGRS